VPNCTPHSAANYIGLPVLLNLVGYVIGTLVLSPVLTAPAVGIFCW
jgi:MFS transporter, putative metabolite:H+ symporter